MIDKISLDINKEEKRYPFSLNWLKNMKELDLNNSIVILVGENGTGKSTLLEMLALRLGLYRIDFKNEYNDLEFKELKTAAKEIKVKCQIKPKGYFFRAEDFINYINYIHYEQELNQKELERINVEYKNKSNYSKMMAESPFRRSLDDLELMYSKDLLKQSHGESYLDFFSSRLSPNNLILLDEPETPLSFQNQLALIAMIKEATKKGCQFIIATHSPVLMAIPQALVYQITDDEISKVKYEEIESVQALKNFLLDPYRYLRHFE